MSTGAGIFEAIEEDDLDRVIKILNNNPEVINITDNQGYTPLHSAVLSENVDIVEAILQAET